MLNQKLSGREYIERVGYIEVMDNMFIGAGMRIIYNTHIGCNVIISPDSMVFKDIPDNSMYSRVPTRFICTFNERVEKAKAYSEEFKELYGADRSGDVSNKLANQIYENFLKNNEQK